MRTPRTAGALSCAVVIALWGCSSESGDFSSISSIELVEPSYVTLSPGAAPTLPTPPETAPTTTTGVASTAAPAGEPVSASPGGDDDATDVSAGVETTSPSESGGDCPTTYVVKEGDTSRIAVAEQFDITYQEMDAANVSTPGYDNFLIGTEVIIPCPAG